MAKWETRFRAALRSAFDEEGIELLVSDYFPPESFAGLTSARAHKTFDLRLRELVVHARVNGWLLDLVAAARERRPRRIDIAVIAEDLGLTAAGPRLESPTNKPFEEVVRKHAKVITPAQFREKLGPLEGQVCWVDVPGGGGTGFLVGPDRVLTAQHVIERVHAGLARWETVTCLFDYRKPIGGADLARKNAREARVKLDPARPVEFERPPSLRDWHPEVGEPAPDDVDCALLRLAERVGDEPIGGSTTDVCASPRRWVDTTKAPPVLTKGDQLFILQHPAGEPPQLAIGTITKLNASGTRVRYDANTKHGSSGSACFNADLELVALHHAYDHLKQPPQWNQGIPLGALQRVWSSRGVTLP